MFHFAKHKHHISFKNGKLHHDQKPIDFSRDPEIVKVVSLLNHHPRICTFTSCQGHFRVAIPTPNQEYSSMMVELISISKDSFYYAHSDSKNSKIKVDLFSDIFPKVDLAKLPFDYQSGWVRILLEESKEGIALREDLHNLTSKTNLLDITVAEERGNSRKSFDLIIGLTPNLKGYTQTSPNQYMNIPWGHVAKLNEQRLDAISILETWAQEKLTA